MGLLTLTELLEKLRSGDETVQIEAKRAEQVGQSIIETVSAYANEPGLSGGYIVCGVELRPGALFLDYHVSGVPDPNKLQSDLVDRCRTMFNTPVRPVVQVESMDNKPVVVVYVPEAQPHEKPIYIKSKGLPTGAYRRIGSSDQHCTDDDVALFYQARDHHTFDEKPITDTSLEDVDPRALAEYRRARAEIKPDAIELEYNDKELLYALAATTRTPAGQYCLTIAGLMLFGKQAVLRRHFPMMRVDYILIPGREWVSHPDNRFQTVEMRDPLLLLIPKLVSHVVSDIPQAFALSENGVHRRDAPLIPRTVIREAIVNSLMHRSYRQRQPVQIIRYANRIEIRNPGHSLKPDDRLGEPGSVSRNEKIAAAIHEVGIAETKGSGIRAMRNAMQNANLTVPFFESDRESDQFTATLLFHHLLGEEDVQWLTKFKDCSLSDDEARVLVVVREIGAINNAYYRSLTGLDTLTVSRRLQHLRDVRLLEQKGKSSATYYVPGERFLQSLATVSEDATMHSPLSVQDPTDKGLSVEQNPTDKGLSVEQNPTDKPLSVEQGISDKPLSDRLRLLPMSFPPLPESLQRQVESLGRRATIEDVKEVVVALCTWRELQAHEVAMIIGRNMRYVVENYLSPAVREGKLAYKHPENPPHPQQGYHAPERTGAK